ncbi:hypothetical protein CTRI78_v012149 [Colletotrichum trifolii]|uniref:dihydroneopterin aldolase n=1 Tax=Colletotrichum trifolii TaxID=5466 RepID=A0A4V3HQJ9_COLTR|nr:hypothetical protein CTRI78_v012149 [Colletotrichum trifolii]
MHSGIPQTTRFTSAWQVRAEAGEPSAVIRVCGLQGTIQAGTDAWGRRGKSQPIVASVELSMASPFHAASASDRVGDDTVHYGLLAKTMLSSFETINKDAEAVSDPSSYTTLRAAADRIWSDITGFTLQDLAGAESGLTLEPAKGGGFLSGKLPAVRYMNLGVTLPKASLLGSGVTFFISAVFTPYKDNLVATVTRSCSLGIHGLRLPTLIGVNSNERLARQVVQVDVDIDMFDASEDVYVEIEDAIVKTLEESSFETLEALGPTITGVIRREVRNMPGARTANKHRWVIKVAMEKPTAITMAAASRVEYRDVPSPAN